MYAKDFKNSIYLSYITKHNNQKHHECHVMVFAYYIILFFIFSYNVSESQDITNKSNITDIEKINKTFIAYNTFEYHTDLFTYAIQNDSYNNYEKYIKIYWDFYPIKNIVSYNNRKIFKGKNIYSIDKQFFNINASFGHFLTHTMNYDLSIGISIDRQKKFLKLPAIIYQISIISSMFYNINTYSYITEFIEDHADSKFLEELTCKIFNKFQPFISFGYGFEVILIQHTPEKNKKYEFHTVEFINLIMNPTIGAKYKMKSHQIYITSAFSYTYGIPFYSYLKIGDPKKKDIYSTFSNKAFLEKSYGYGISIGIEKHF